MIVGRLLKSYFLWHYSFALTAWWRIYGNCLWFLYHFFSVSILIRTLFSPWRRLAENYSSGFVPQVIAETLVVNTLMRLVGFTIRVSFLLFAWCVIIGAFFLGWLTLVLWLVAPLLIPFVFLIGFYLAFLT